MREWLARTPHGRMLVKMIGEEYANLCAEGVPVTRELVLERVEHRLRAKYRGIGWLPILMLLLKLLPILIEIYPYFREE